MTDNSLTTNTRVAGRTRSLVYSVFVLALIASAVYFFASPAETVKAKKAKKAPAAVLATATFLTNTTVPLPIPDNTASGVNLSIPVAGLTDQVRGVALNITADQPNGAGGHTWIGDLTATLTAPGGAPSHLIFQRTGSLNGATSGDSSDFQGPYTFTDGSTGDLWNSAGLIGNTIAVAAGSYRTQACCAPTATGAGINTKMNPIFQGPALSGSDIKNDMKSRSDIPVDNVGNGTWMLNISDNAGGDTGRVAALSLTITTLAPTAATAEVRGRVITPASQGIGRAFITIVNTTTLDSYVVMSNQFGYFTASELPVGDVYTMSVSHKQYQFPVATQAFTLSGDVGDAVFISGQ